MTKTEMTQMSISESWRSLAYKNEMNCTSNKHIYVTYLVAIYAISVYSKNKSFKGQTLSDDVAFTKTGKPSVLRGI